MYQLWSLGPVGGYFVWDFTDEPLIATSSGITCWNFRVNLCLQPMKQIKICGTQTKGGTKLAKCPHPIPINAPHRQNGCWRSMSLTERVGIAGPNDRRATLHRRVLRLALKVTNQLSFRLLSSSIAF